MKNLIICGTGALARELYWHLMGSFGYGTEWVLKGFLDGSVPVGESEYKKLQLPVLGVFNDYKIERDDVFTCGVGTPRIRKDFIETIESHGGKFINVIHKTALVQGNAKLGTGIVLCPFAYVNDNAVVEDHVLINMMSGLGHDASIGKYSCLMGHVELCGFVSAGEETYFGCGAKVLPHSKIGDNAFIGAGSVVLKNVKAGKKVFGNPAKYLDL